MAKATPGAPAVSGANTTPSYVHPPRPEPTPPVASVAIDGYDEVNDEAAEVEAEHYEAERYTDPMTRMAAFHGWLGKKG